MLRVLVRAMMFRQVAQRYRYSAGGRLSFLIGLLSHPIALSKSVQVCSRLQVVTPQRGQSSLSVAG